MAWPQPDSDHGKLSGRRLEIAVAYAVGIATDELIREAFPEATEEAFRKRVVHSDLWTGLWNHVTVVDDSGLQALRQILERDEFNNAPLPDHFREHLESELWRRQLCGLIDAGNLEEAVAAAENQPKGSRLRINGYRALAAYFAVAGNVTEFDRMLRQSDRRKDRYQIRQLQHLLLAGVTARSLDESVALAEERSLATSTCFQYQIGRMESADLEEAPRRSE